MKKRFLNLQLFGEDGDGGDGGIATTASETNEGTSGEEFDARIPERARKNYQEAVKKHKPAEPGSTKTAEGAKEEKPSYEDLIKSDDYKDQHKAYMDKTIANRLKKYKGMEDSYNQTMGILDIIAGKYGISPDDPDFLATLRQKAEADDSYYENYAMEHDISTEEARKIVTMERKVSKMEAEKKEAERQAKMQEQIMVLRQNADETKRRFPSFDLETEWADERFRKLCYASNGDTTAAYMACHWNDVLPATVQMASQKIREQTVQAIAAGKDRPIENGASGQASSVVDIDFKGMSLKELREYAETQRRKKR